MTLWNIKNNKEKRGISKLPEEAMVTTGLLKKSFASGPIDSFYGQNHSVLSSQLEHFLSKI